MIDVLRIVIRFLPFLMALYVANLAQMVKEKKDDSDSFYGQLTIFGSLFAFGMLFIFGWYVQFVAWGWLEGQFLERWFVIARFEHPNSFAFGIWISAFLSLSAFSPSVRRPLAGWLGLDPDNFVHIIVIALIPMLLMQTILTYGIGLSTLAENIAQQPPISNNNAIIEVWGQELMFAVVAFIGVGWLSRRRFAQLCERLGLKWPTARELLIGVSLGVFLVGVAFAIGAVAYLLGWNNSSADALSSALFSPLLSTLPGVLTVGLAAALGEELLFRGALQPRLGRVTTALIFAIVHSQYGVSVTIVALFGMGYVLSLVRDVYNTPTAMILHATFNIIQGLAIYAGLNALA